MAARAPLTASAAHELPSIRLERLRTALLWLAGATSAVVFIEPSPYEIASLGAIVLFALTGLTLTGPVLVLSVLLVLINLGYTISASALMHQKNVLTWVVTSWYLAVTCVFFAAALAVNTERRVNALMRGCIAAGVIAALAGLAGYFRVVPGGTDLLLLYDRARGTFKDPNVFGAFLILPAMLALQGVMAGTLRRAFWNLSLLGIFAAGVLVSFSRAAWGQMIFAAALVMFLTFVTTPSPAQRLRIVLIGAAGAAAMTLLLAALLSTDTVAALLKERLSFNQSYDVGETGRFARHALGAVLALDLPLGIGPLQFSKIFPEDPHNTFLNAFMSGGWLSGVALPTLVMLTLGFGLRPVFTPAPWQPVAIAVYAAYLANVIESVVIDTDHWRHAFLLLGVMWGLIGATAAWRRQAGLARRGMPQYTMPGSRSVAQPG